MENSGTANINIILTGPESTGKTLLAEQLATIYNGRCIPEYAREYLLELRRPYTYEDVLKIAEKQLEEMETLRNCAGGMNFFDTYLIITKVWLEVVYNNTPDWIDRKISGTRDALYLLCRPDIPWKPDPLRENGGEMRIKLFLRYEEELKQKGLYFGYVEGAGEDRILCAKQIIDRYIRNR